MNESVEKQNQHNTLTKLKRNVVGNQLTVSPCAINSSGTNSGLNTAGVTQGHLVFVGNRVTITSPLAAKANGQNLISEMII